MTDPNIEDNLDPKVIEEISRISETIARLDKEALGLLARQELFHQLNDRTHGISKSHGANAFNLLIESLIHTQVLTLCRIWDHDDRSYSVPSLFKYLRKGKHKYAIFREQWYSAERRALRGHVISDLSEDTIRRIRLDNLSRYLTDAVNKMGDQYQRLMPIMSYADEFMNSEIRAHLFELRVTKLAHATEISSEGKNRVEAGLSVRDPLIGEVLETAERSMQIIEELQWIFRSVVADYSEFQDIWARNTKDLIETRFQEMADTSPITAIARTRHHS